MEFGTRRAGLAARRPNDALLRWATDRTKVLVVGLGLGIMVGRAFTGAPATAPHQVTPVKARAAASAAAPNKAPAPVTPLVAPRLARTLASGGTIQVGVFGDSFGDGVWAALRQRLPAKAGYDVHQFSHEGTGFTRYRQLDVEARAKEQVAAQPVDIAVIDFGANDVQGLYDDKGHVQALLSPGWQKVYGDRAEGMVRLLRNQGAAVYWMGLPKMRKDQYDSDITAIGEVLRQRMEKLGVPYIPVRDLSTDEHGAYQPYMADAKGQKRLMRAGDGIHMTFAGYTRLTDPVTARIAADIARLRPGKPAGAQAAACPAAPAPTPPAARVSPTPPA